MYNIISRLCELHCNHTFCIKKDSKLLSSDLNVLSSVPSIIPRWNLIVRLEGVLRRTVGSDWRFNTVSRIRLQSQVTEYEFCSVRHNQQSFLGLVSSGLSDSSEVCNSNHFQFFVNAILCSHVSVLARLWLLQRPWCGWWACWTLAQRCYGRC